MRISLSLLFVVLTLFGCQNQESSVEKEPWIEKPVSEWPDIVLTNTIQFADSTYKDIGNSFLVDTGYDTVAVTCKHIDIQSLINADAREEIGEFNTLKVRDWIIFSLDNPDLGFHPLRMRADPVRKGEVVYSLGWGYDQVSKTPSLIKMQVYQNLDSYFYVQTLSENVNSAGRSGSPVIDKNGLLVGLVSGAEGKLGVMGSVGYLRELFEEYGIRCDDVVE